MDLIKVNDIRNEEHIINFNMVCAISFTGKLATLQLLNRNIVTLTPKEFEKISKSNYMTDNSNLIEVSDIRSENHIVNLKSICAISFNNTQASLQLSNNNVVSLDKDEFNKLKKHIKS